MVTDRFGKDFDTDVKREDVVFVENMSPMTITEEEANEGYSNTTKPTK